jgi:uncharacterized protein YndB with AHSA1/START domain
MPQAGTTLAVEHEIHIEAPPETVFRLLTEKEEICRWMTVPVFDARVGGALEMTAGEHVAFGEITRLEPPRVVAYTWDWRDQPIGTRTEVTFEVEPDGSGSLVRLRHDGFAQPEQVQAHSHGWAHYGQRLAAVAEGRDPGPDTMGQEDA